MTPRLNLQRCKVAGGPLPGPVTDDTRATGDQGSALGVGPGGCSCNLVRAAWMHAVDNGHRQEPAGMPHKTFVAFSSADPIVSDMITGACEAARTPEHDFSPWNRNDASGQPIDKSVHGWVGTANALLADVSEPNHNVGLAQAGRTESFTAASNGRS